MDHLDAAAVLPATRHQRDRLSEAHISPRYNDPAPMPVLRDLLATDGTRGVTALRDGRVVGSLPGALELRSPTPTFAGLMRPRSAEIAYAGHAADPGEGGHLSPRLYPALAGE